MRVPLLLIALFASPASAGDFQVWGQSDQDSHFLSVTELIGRPEFFNDQPVSVVGIAQFRDGPQPVFRLYATRDDLANAIPAAVKIGHFPESLGLTDDEMASLNGRTVLIEGTFQIYERPRLEPGAGTSHICLRDCGLPGEITDIVRVTTWPPR